MQQCLKVKWNKFPPVPQNKKLALLSPKPWQNSEYLNLKGVGARALPGVGLHTHRWLVPHFWSWARNGWAELCWSWVKFRGGGKYSWGAYRGIFFGAWWIFFNHREVSKHLKYKSWIGRQIIFCGWCKPRNSDEREQQYNWRAGLLETRQVWFLSPQVL